MKIWIGLLGYEDGYDHDSDKASSSSLSALKTKRIQVVQEMEKTLCEHASANIDFPTEESFVSHLTQLTAEAKQFADSIDNFNKFAVGFSHTMFFYRHRNDTDMPDPTAYKLFVEDKIAKLVALLNAPEGCNDKLLYDTAEQFRTEESNLKNKQREDLAAANRAKAAEKARLEQRENNQFDSDPALFDKTLAALKQRLPVKNNNEKRNDVIDSLAARIGNLTDLFAKDRTAFRASVKTINTNIDDF